MPRQMPLSRAVPYRSSLLIFTGQDRGWAWRFRWRLGNGRWTLSLEPLQPNPEDQWTALGPQYEFTVRPSPRVDEAMTPERAGLIIEGCLRAFRRLGPRAPRPAHPKREQAWKEAP